MHHDATAHRDAPKLFNRDGGPLTTDHWQPLRAGNGGGHSGGKSGAADAGDLGDLGDLIQRDDDAEEFELPAYLMTADERERRQERERTARAREAVRGEDGRFRPQSPPPAAGEMAAGGEMQLAVAGGEEEEDVDEEFCRGVCGNGA